MAGNSRVKAKSYDFASLLTNDDGTPRDYVLVYEADKQFEDDTEVLGASNMEPARWPKLLNRLITKLQNLSWREDYDRRKALKDAPQPGDSYPQDPSRYIPRSIFVEKNERTARLLELEQLRDNVMHQIMEERLRVFGREPTGDSGDSHYWSFGVAQSIFDMLQHYGSKQVMDAILGYLLFSDRVDGVLSEEMQTKLYERLRGELLDQTKNRWDPGNAWRFKLVKGTYVFPDFVEEEDKAEA